MKRRVFIGLIAGTGLIATIGGLHSVYARTTQPKPVLVAQQSASVPPFSDQATPAGTPSLADLHFSPPKFTAFPLLFPTLNLTYQAGMLTVTAQGKTTPLWSGPIAQAAFVQETFAGVHTLKDSTGKMLWSDAPLTPPDLTLHKAADGQARLTDKNGTVLWSGQLPPTGSSVSSRVTSGGGSQHLQAAGVHIDGVKGAFRVTTDAGQLLWAGQLPTNATVLITDTDNHQRSYLVSGPSLSGGGQDEISHVTFTAEPGTVTVADTQGQELGTRPVEIIVIHGMTYSGSQARATHWPVSTPTSEPSLSATGTLLLTYRDQSGKVVRRVKVFSSPKDKGTLG